jgi:pimeloyl-ACP methyl ester carboxylesterase
MNPIINPQTVDWIAEYEAQAVRHVVHVGEYEVVWRLFGQGEPLALFHGGHGSWMHWARNIDALSRHFSVWIPNLPGYGDSSTPLFDDFQSLVDVTLASMDQLFGPEVAINLCGFSFGGLVAANIAAKRPAVKRLALLGPAGHGGPRRPRGKLQNWKIAESESDVIQAMRHNLWVHMLYADEQIDPLAVGIHTDSCVKTRYRSRGHSFKGDLSEALNQYLGEMLFAWGAHDVTATPEVLVQTLVQTHPGRKHLIIPATGHWVQYEAAAPINQALVEWFSPGKAD